MKSLILAIVFLFPVRVFAQCEKAAAMYGDGHGNDTIPAECYEGALKLALPAAKKDYPEHAIRIIGLKNIVFVNKNIYAGEYTMLEDVVAVAFDKRHNEIGVLERNGDILIFSAKLPGNVAPLRVIRHADLDGASDLAFLPESGEVAALIPAHKEILTFSREANFYGREGKRKLEIKRQLRNSPMLPEK